jgi:hypothetical protein
MSWSSVSDTMPTDGFSSSMDSSSRNGDSIPTLISRGSNDRMSMESVSSLSSSHSLVPFTTTLANNNTTPSHRTTSMMLSDSINSSNNSSVRRENPLPPLHRHRSVSFSGNKKASIVPPPSASSMSTPFPRRTLQPIGNRIGGTPGQANAAAPAGFAFLKSPTTLTFERMIEACTYDAV